MKRSSCDTTFDHGRSLADLLNGSGSDESDEDDNDDNSANERKPRRGRKPKYMRKEEEAPSPVPSPLKETPEEKATQEAGSSDVIVLDDDDTTEIAADKELPLPPPVVISLEEGNKRGKGRGRPRGRGRGRGRGKKNEDYDPAEDEAQKKILELNNAYALLKCVDVSHFFSPPFIRFMVGFCFVNRESESLLDSTDGSTDCLKGTDPVVFDSEGNEGKSEEEPVIITLDIPGRTPMKLGQRRVRFFFFFLN